MTGDDAEAPPTVEPDLDEEVAAVAGNRLRTGWTTGTCASAAAKAATMALLHGRAPERVEVALPSGRRVDFAVEPSVEAAGDACCVVVKDAGDDPDCTDGARLTARVRWGSPGGGTEIRGGPGVGTVTRPGLGLEVGGPAINPVPTRMIRAAVAEVTDRPVVVTISVPGGVEMAARTSNERLGIVGGISILGTTGIVRPYSTAAYRASVVRQLDVAAAGGQRVAVLATGSRTDAAAQRMFPALASVCFVEVGDFAGTALRHAASVGVTEVVVVAMAGKIAKLAGGVMMTHFRRSHVDGELLAEAAGRAGAPASVVAAATETATARHFAEACQAAGALGALDELCARAAAACRAHAPSLESVRVLMVDFDGDAVVGRGHAGAAPLEPPGQSPPGRGGLR